MSSREISDFGFRISDLSPGQVESSNSRNSKSEIRNPKSIFLKISPDLTLAQLDDIVEVVLETKIAGVIASNTTISRERLRTPNSQLQTIGNGGLSGRPLTTPSTEMIRYLSLKAQGKFTIIGCGGIFSAGDALEKINAGAELVQVYTGFIYEGPSMVKKISKKLCDVR